VKNAIKILGVSFVILAYFFTVIFVKTNSLNSKSYSCNNLDLSNNYYFSSTESSIYHIFQTEEQLIISIKEVYIFKNSLNKISISLDCIDKILHNDLKLNNLFLNKLLIKFQRADVTFPFYYYW